MVQANWNPKPIWRGDDAYIIGGGTSLRDFNWSLLKGKNTVGCNSACTLGAEVCQYCVFGDYDWWKNIGSKQTDYKGIWVTALANNAAFPTPDHVQKMERHFGDGLGTDSLGWNCNTGSLAINLALILGASRVYLLGFDMKMKNGKHNWHDLRWEQGEDAVYKRMVKDFAPIAKDLPKKFPGREIINITSDSDLPHFPRRDLAAFFNPQKIGV